MHCRIFHNSRLFTIKISKLGLIWLWRNKKLCDGLTNDKMESMCGRPLGLKFNTLTCELYIADAYFGLLVVGPSGGVAKQLATSAEGVPFRFTNALDIDTKTGEVYFTDSSILFQRRYTLNSCYDMHFHIMLFYSLFSIPLMCTFISTLDNWLFRI